MLLRSQSEEGAFSLVELIIAIGITSVIGYLSTTMFSNFNAAAKEIVARENADQDYEAIAKIINLTLKKADTSTVKVHDCGISSGDNYCEKITFKSVHNSILPYDVEIDTNCHLLKLASIDAEIKSVTCSNGKCSKRPGIKIKGKRDIVFPAAGSKTLGMYLCIQKEANRFRFHYLTAFKAGANDYKKTGRMFSVDLFKLEGDKLQYYTR